MTIVKYPRLGKVVALVPFLGFTDAHSWINEAGQGPDYPLLFDENYQPKPAYWGVMDALIGK